MHSVGEKTRKIIDSGAHENKKGFIFDQLNLLGPSRIISGGPDLRGFIDKMNVLYFMAMHLTEVHSIYGVSFLNLPVDMLLIIRGSTSAAC